MVHIRPATVADAEIIKQLAEAIWHPTYTPILGPEQVGYMLNLFYTEDKLREQIDSGEQTYIILQEENMPIAFAAYAPRTENQDVYKLHKLYCLTNKQGKGYGRLLLHAVEDAVTDAGKNTLELNVNRYNPALDFYKRNGFEVAYVEDIDIGNGYWMNDYVMRKTMRKD